MNRRAVIEDGILKIDGRPTFVWSSDYPYYRDQQADWSSQLDNLKKMNVDVVTFYIPWRHHAPVDPLRGSGFYDFEGQLGDRTHVREFIRLIREKKMYCIVKPGPYIHAETRFGSLPDYVLPDNNPKIHARVDMQGNPAAACWGFAKPPAPLDPEYLEYVRHWFAAVAREVIVPNEFPDGPILAVQVLNEGIYSDGGYEVEKIHFDPPAVGHYREFLREKYGAIGRYNETCATSFKDFAEIPAPRMWSSPTTREAVRPWLDWAEFGQHVYRKIAATYVGYLRDAGVTLPTVMNINPPAAPRGTALETVTGRYTVPFLSHVMQYGYTNWCGVVSHNEDAWLKYKFVGKAARGINMEENWGFDSYDPPYYWSVQPSYFQSMAYLLWGATGLNIYLGVSCDCWTDYLAPDAGGVYMHNHPIAEDGSFRAGFWTCHQMGALMKNIGSDLVAQPLREPVGWGFYSPYAHAASWDSAPQDWKRIGFPGRPHAAWFGWDSFMALCEKRRTPNGIGYPREESVERLLRFPVLFLDGNAWMDAATQRRLADYVERGGTLVLTSHVPDLDEFFRPCTILRDALFPCEAQVVSDDGGFTYAFADGEFGGAGRGRLESLTALGAGVEPLVMAKAHGKAATCGVMARRGKGNAIFLGFSPWQTESGEWGSTGLVEHIARRHAGLRMLATVTADSADPLVEVAEFPCDARHRRYVYVLTRRDKPVTHHVSLADSGERRSTFEIRLPSYSGALAGFENGRIVAALIKGTNDLDKSAAAPRLEMGGEKLAAKDPCDLYFCRRDDGTFELSVVNVQTARQHTTVTLPRRAADVSAVVRLTSGGREEPVAVKDVEGWAAFDAADMRLPGNGEWSPGYRIVCR